MNFRYMSGEEIRPRDQVLFHGESGEVEFVATTISDDAGLNYYVEEFGGGAMLCGGSFGRVFVSDPQNDEDLVFVSRR